LKLQATLQCACAGMNQGGRESQKKNADLADGESAGSFTDNSKTSEKREMFSQL
jgi:hypothetical protein